MKKIVGWKVVVAVVIVGLVVVAVLDKSTSLALAASPPGQSETPMQPVEEASATTAAAGATPAPVPVEGSGSGMAALARASASGRYLFIFFSKEDDQSTAALRKVFDGAMAKAGDRCNSVAVRVDDPAEREIVAKYGVTKAPMPLVLAVAPNGAVTGGFPGTFEEKALLDAFASPSMEKCLKALQERKLVLLCVQNGATKANDAATKGAEDFKADARFAQFTEIVRVDPADEAEGKFMSKLRIEPKTVEAVTALLAPPGAVVGTFKGAVDKDALVSALMAAMSGGCGAGASSGCCPK